MESGNQGSTHKESGIHGVESRIYDCPGFPYMGRTDKLYTGGRLSFDTRECRYKPLSWHYVLVS